VAKEFADLGVELQRAVSDVVRLPDPAIVRAIGEQAITIIALRTKSGIDADHRMFKPYVRGYADFRRRKNLRPNPPDLAVTGQMIGAMVAVPGRDEVTIEFRSAKDALKAAVNDAERNWFDLRQEDEVSVISELVLDAIEERWGRG
jgi:hypothetical protein